MSAQNLLPDHTIIVTGAATGIGQAFALGAAAQGAHVVVADMHAADETLDLIAQAGGRAGAALPTLLALEEKQLSTVNLNLIRKSGYLL
jgi:NAD(P)-dependent dehydrogenase (short-subunit alcohol dehydrogenase family)